MKTMLRILLVCAVLLLLPAVSMGEAIELEGVCTGFQYSDGNTEIEASLEKLIQDGQLDDILSDPQFNAFTCEWEPHPVLKELEEKYSLRYWSNEDSYLQKEDSLRGNPPVYRYYNLSTEQIQKYKLDEATVVTCYFYGRKADKAELLQAEISFKLGELIHAPTFPSENDETRQLFFDQGKEMTVTFPEVKIEGSSAGLYYHLIYSYSDPVNDEWRREILFKDQTSPVFQCRFTEDDHGAVLSCDVSFEPYDSYQNSWVYNLEYVLQDSSRSKIIMPEMKGLYMQEIAVYRNETVELTVPAAKGEGLVYRWRVGDPGGGDREVRYTTEPVLPLTYETAVDGGSYSCEVGFEGQADSFLFYPHMYYPVLIDKPREAISITANQQASGPQTLKLESSQTVSQVLAADEPVAAMFGGDQDMAEDALIMYQTPVETVADLKKLMIRLLEQERPGLMMGTTAVSGQTLYDVEIIADASAADGKPMALLPYPDGTDRNMQFTVAHMFDSGEIEIVTGVPTEQGILAAVGGASPMLLQWQGEMPSAAPEESIQETTPELPSTGDSTPLAALAALLALSVAGMMILRRRVQA